MFARKLIIVLTILFSCSCVFLLSAHSEAVSVKEQAAKAAKIATYLKLRLDYSKSAEYNPYDQDLRGIIGEYDKLMAQGKFTEAIEKAKEGLQKDKYNIQLLVSLASTYRRMGDIKNADAFREEWTGLADSIFISGDGKTAETAFIVISVAEEYAVLGILGLDCVGQKHVIVKDVNFDILEVQDKKSGRKFDLYFNIDIPFKWLAKSMGSDIQN